MIRDATKEIWEMVANSGNNFRRGVYPQKITFGDFVDIVLLYICLQVDIDYLGKISMEDFRSLLKETVDYWLQHNRDKYQFADAYLQEIGEAEEERYMLFYPGIAKYECLSSFLDFNYGRQGWMNYQKEHIRPHVLPKWRENIRDLDEVLVFAEEFCERIRT